jgi:hypothetical protein
VAEVYRTGHRSKMALLGLVTRLPGGAFNLVAVAIAGITN